MPSPEHWKTQTRLPRGKVDAWRRERDAETLAAYLEDAAHTPGGHSPEICFPANEAEVAAVLAGGIPVLAIGAQSSLTGGATPFGEVLLSTSRMRQSSIANGRARAGAGLLLRELEESVAAANAYFPPVPTYDGASVGGVIATCAAGAATFKHGTTRGWVQELTVVLACGEVLEIERGQVTSHPRGYFEVERTSSEVLRIPVPLGAHPDVPKSSAGYWTQRPLDLIDLFIGAEGTLGVVVEAVLRLSSPRPSWLAVLVPVADDAAAVALTTELREEARSAHRTGNPCGLDVSAIEYMDARSLQVLREDGVAERVGVTLPASARALLLIQAELPAGFDRARAYHELSESYAADIDGPVVRLCRILERHGVLADAVPALPGEEDRRRALFALREAVPEGVNRRVREVQRSGAARVSKSGGDVIVPFERFEESLQRYRALLAEAGLDAAIWGHISDGNVHPNILARSDRDMDHARQTQLAIGEVAIALGGSPMAEHGTGRNPIKKALLEKLHGKAGVASMRMVKRCLDPHWQLAPGVLFDLEETR
ncbi:MAG TPA: FAD-binding oxidoreductase [Candidatus Limnocylindrales bacterium]|nr:FAD-binding oxidoreductase [Candidatus Limnocylindrales bacterium]